MAQDDPARDDAGVRLSAEAWESLFRAQVAVMRRLQQLEEFKELSMREYDVLFNLARCPEGGLRQGDLTPLLLMSQPSLSRMIDRLETRGFLRRAPDPADQRAVRLTLTEEGAAVQRRIGRAHVRHIRDLVSPALEPAELRELERLTAKLRGAVEGG
ncbi:MarR family winged helix-turn-helix transcriptional regulator [Zafaria sp. Z1313]|uniref:MarR family winged helix-turn-helix transcriptional regulator n=1 Tax=unclassified Zafaria TaxID=2828765 RepID=UPI002E79FD35|nr:MarR family transcriptional regulator [Zafaria sp. J156]MEE1620793.1 MarR family transcriptional regulator [Zafaria sp. J156]